MKKTAAFVISLFILCAAAGAADIPGEEFDKLGGVAFNVPGQITGGLANLASANSNSFKITAGNESLCIEINGTSGTVTLDLGTFGPAKIAEMINIRARNGARAKEYLAPDGNYKLAVFSMGLTDTLRIICGINTDIFGFPTYTASAIPARVEMMADGKPVGAGNPLPVIPIAQGIYTCTSVINTAEVCVVTCVFEVQGWNFVCNGTTANSYCLIYDSVSGTTETLYADGSSDYVALNINTLMQNPIFIINNASCTNVTFKIWGRIN